MIRKYIFSVLATLLALMLFSLSAVAAAPEVVVTNSGLALFMGETTVEPGSSVIIQIVPEGEGPLTADGKINGYVNETIVQRDGKYKLLFSIEEMYEQGKSYVCHVDLASKEYYLVPVTEGSLIEVSENNFNRDSKVITVAGSLWDSSVYGIDLKLTINGFSKTVTSSTNGDFKFEFTMSDAGITDYGVYNFVISYADDASNYCENSIELVNAEPVLAEIKANSNNAVELEKILTNPQKLQILGFDSSILYGDNDFSELIGSSFFGKLAKVDVKTDTVAALEKDIKTAYAIYAMQESPSDRNLRRCIDLFNLAADDAITLLYDGFNEDTEPKYLFNLWTSTDFTKIEDACAFYKDAVVRTKLNTAEAWSNLMLFVNGNTTLLGVEAQQATGFWQNLIYKAPFDSLGDFKTKYNQTLSIGTVTPPDGGGGGGGSTGGGATTKPSIGINSSTNNQNTQQPQTPATKPIFSDISNNHWAAEAVTKLYEMGIVSGKNNGKYAPDDLVTRAEVAKLMCTSAKIDTADINAGNFADVDSKHWAKTYIDAAFANGLVNGTGNNNFAPEDCTTREDMAVFCYRLLKILNPQNKDEVYTKDDLTFADSSEISDYAVEAVAAMSKLGIINGKGDNKFDPKAKCTRAEAAKIFYGVLQ